MAVAEFYGLWLTIVYYSIHGVFFDQRSHHVNGSHATLPSLVLPWNGHGDRVHQACSFHSLATKNIGLWMVSGQGIKDVRSASSSIHLYLVGICNLDSLISDWDMEVQNMETPKTNAIWYHSRWLVPGYPVNLQYFGCFGPLHSYCFEFQARELIPGAFSTTLCQKKIIR